MADPEDSELLERALALVKDMYPRDPAAQFVAAARLSRVMPAVLRALGPDARARASLGELSEATGFSRGRIGQICGPLPAEEARRRKSTRSAAPPGG